MMIDLIVFSVSGNRYALNIENVQRIIQSVELTNIPNSHKYIDGMMSYEDKVIKVLDFRKLIGIQSYNEELLKLFDTLKNGHEEWIDELKHAVTNGATFTKTFDPHACELGKWLDNFNSYDDEVSEILTHLVKSHKLLHSSGEIALELSKNDEAAALTLLNTDIYDLFKQTMGNVDSFISKLEKVVDSLQKLIIYDQEGTLFAIKVDIIEDIAHVEENQFINSGDNSETNDFLDLEGVLDLEGILINIIKTVNLPK